MANSSNWNPTLRKYEVIQPNGSVYLSNNPEGVRFSQPKRDGTEFVFYDPNPKQLIFHGMDASNVLAYGGRGSGKSLALRMEAHIRAISTPNFTYAILRRTYPELQKSHLVHISKEMKMLGGHFNKTEKIAYYPNGSVGFFAHCETDGDTLKLLSSEYAWMGFDELSTFEWEMFMKLSASCRVTEDSNLVAMVRCCTNPLGPSAEEINRHFILKDITPEEDAEYAPESWAAIQINIEDNPAINSETYLKRLTSGMSSHVKTAWVDGEFSFENALFDFYPTKRIETAEGIVKYIPYHVTDVLDIERIVKLGKIYRAFDMGWFPDPAYCVWIAHLGNRYVAFHEQKWFKTIAPDIAHEILEADQRLGIKRVVITYCDPSMDIQTGHDHRSMKSIFEANGVPMEGALNDRVEFARALHRALGEEAQELTPRLQIYRHGMNGCPYLAKTIPQMRFNPKKIEAMADHPQDHAVVALAYFLMSRSSESIPSYDQQSQPKWMREKLAHLKRPLGYLNVQEKSPRIR